MNCTDIAHTQCKASNGRRNAAQLVQQQQHAKSRKTKARAESDGLLGDLLGQPTSKSCPFLKSPDDADLFVVDSYIQGGQSCRRERTSLLFHVANGMLACDERCQTQTEVESSFAQEFQFPVNAGVAAIACRWLTNPILKKRVGACAQ